MTPFLTMPGTCLGSEPTPVAWADSWEQPGRYVRAQTTLPALANCDRLPFHPEIAVRPESTSADGALGVGVTVTVPQVESAAAIVATPPLRGATITLPQGVSINPSVGDGLQACAASGPDGIDIPAGSQTQAVSRFNLGKRAKEKKSLPKKSGPEEPILAPGHCPEASTVGTAEAITPLLPSQIEGRVYLAAPGCGGPAQSPCSEQDAVDGNLYRLYVELGGKAGRRAEGVLIKLVGNRPTNPATGQLTVRLTDAPQLPISQLTLRMFGGSRALLANPSKCGAATTTVDLEPWSAPYAPDAAPSSYYEVKGCTGVHAPAPKLIAGSVNALAGAFSPFTFTVTDARERGGTLSLPTATPRARGSLGDALRACRRAKRRLQPWGAAPTARASGAPPWRWVPDPHCGWGVWCT